MGCYSAFAMPEAAEGKGSRHAFVRGMLQCVSVSLCMSNATLFKQVAQDGAAVSITVSQAQR